MPELLDRRDTRPSMSDETKCSDKCGVFVSRIRVVESAIALFDGRHTVLSDRPGTHASTPAQRWARCLAGVDPTATPPGDDAGHVIAKDLGGSGAGPDNIYNPQPDFNIYPQHPGTNRVIQRTREGRVKRVAEAGNRVCIQVFLRYNQSSDPLYPARPTSIIYDVWVNGVLNPDLGPTLNFREFPEPIIHNPET